ncbi:MAG TPA: hypothetical protein VFK35_05300 [Candidatus Limnocylindrales bacterium]|nr:hypothetical protein [Candidatus Limnocylindrales bacterium]
MIHNAVIHIANEQPLLADLFETPSTTDVSLVCTNVRMLDGKKPIFIDRTDSVFVFPYLHVRFIEIPAAAVAPEPADAEPVAVAVAPVVDPEPDVEIEIDEDFLRRIREV